MKMMGFPLIEVSKIHYANGYDNDAKAQEAFNRVSNELGAAAWADAFSAPSFDDYAEAIDAIDDEPFVSYDAEWDFNNVASRHHY
jgi:hypothetical protein